MNAVPFITALIISLFLFVHNVALAADTTAKELARNEERMRDEKRRDEQQAKDYSNRVKVARFDSVWRPPGTNDLDVIQAHESISKAHRSIALLTFDCAAKEETQAVAGFIAKAKDLGADGVLMIGFELPSIQHLSVFSPDERRVFRANAIVYLGKD